MLGGPPWHSLDVRWSILTALSSTTAPLTCYVVFKRLSPECHTPEYLILTGFNLVNPNVVFRRVASSLVIKLLVVHKMQIFNSWKIFNRKSPKGVLAISRPSGLQDLVFLSSEHVKFGLTRRLAGLFIINTGICLTEWLASQNGQICKWFCN